MPGRTHISLTVAWALDHDPAKVMREAAIPEGDEDNPEAAPAAAAAAEIAAAAADSPAARQTSPRDAAELRVQLSSKSTSSLAVAQPGAKGHR